jgi:hypothetical protein
VGGAKDDDDDKTPTTTAAYTSNLLAVLGGVEGTTTPSMLNELGGATLSEKINLQCMNLEYVDFNEMLKDISGHTNKDQTYKFLVDNEGNLKQTTDPLQKKHRFLGQAAWQECFDMWINITLTYHPTMDSVLRKYRGTLTTLNKRYLLSAPGRYRAYDQRFRQGVGQMARLNKLHNLSLRPRFEAIDTILEASVYLGKTPSSCTVCGAISHDTFECTPMAAAATATLVSRAAMQDETAGNSTCFGYNNLYGAKGCTRSPCEHEHTCATCRGNHPQFECKIKNSSQKKWSPPTAKTD